MATTIAASTKRKVPPDNPDGKVVKYRYVLSTDDDTISTCQFCRMQGSYVEVITNGPQHHTDTAVLGTPCPRYDPDTAVRVLSALEKEHRERVARIRKNVEEAKQQFLAQIKVDERKQLNDASQAYHMGKERLLKSCPTDARKCSICQASLVIPAGKCIEENCSTIVCKTCLKNKVDNCFKCECCNEIKNFMCSSCVEKIKGWYQFDNCREDCAFLCPDHVQTMESCVCGSCALCNGPSRQCSIDTCGRCGDYLCSRCDSKEGCMCLETKGDY